MNKALSVFVFDIDKNPKPVAFYAEFLSQNERLRLSKISNEKRKLQYAAGRFVLKSVLKEKYKVISPKVLLNKKNNKPYVRGFFKFNLSHSGRYIVLAVGEKTEVGVDIETKATLASVRSIAERYFSEVENKYIFSAKTEAAKINHFLTLWSLKEAYIKSIGGLINEKTIKIEFNLMKKKVTGVSSDKTLSFMYNAHQNISVCVAVAVRKSDFACFNINTTAKGLKISRGQLQFNRLAYKKSTVEPND